jgi:hypothetical protein
MEDDFCRTTPRKAFGPLLRLTLYGASAPSFTLTGYAGSELLEPGLAAIGELGLTVGKQPRGNGGWGLSPHTGFGVEWYMLNSSSQQEWLLDTYPVAGGVRFLPLVAQPVTTFCAVGRPQRDGWGQRVAEAAPTGCPKSLLNQDRAEDPPQADAWCADARAEYASVPAFLRLAIELEAAGAPRELAARARAAAFDELRHTALCAEAASVFTGRAWAPEAPRVERRPRLSGPAALRRLALESWLDGCLGEGLAAALAENSAEHGPDAVSRSVQRAIAPDERRHAELGWDIVKWCLATDAAVAPLLRAAMQACVDAPPRALENTAQRQRVAARHRQLQQAQLRQLV